MRLIHIVVASITLFDIARISIAQQAVASDMKTAAIEIRQLMQAVDWKDLTVAVAHWRKDLTLAQRKELIIQLVAWLPREGELKLTVPNDVWLTAREDVRKVTAQTLLAHRDAERIRQDLLQENGRAAWAIEELLYCELPVCGGVNSENTPDHVAQVAQFVIQAMQAPPVDESAAVGDRVRWAGDFYASQTLLRHLASDVSPQVRAAVARNPNTHPKILDALAKDTDPEVRQAAVPRSFSAGTIESILGVGWFQQAREAATKEASLPQKK